ncbi:MAG: hypothetical protein COU69_02980 [Candidatus Pacebacteria bacterium CG10_big_fil_rev_8_21_14_0_10_56_10]|nr:MAG: hypothetical protein COU69_02980 [Candidatus Pacebacteria bacterium CG10_big_fil_rev_8_21_14_0_10_56_10]
MQLPPLEYTHKTHPRSRSIKIKVLPDTRLEVVTPPGTDRDSIDRFLVSQLGWVERTRRRLGRLPVVWDDQRVMLFGEYYQLRRLADADRLPAIAIDGQSLLVSAPTGRDQVRLRRFLRHTAQAYITPRAHQLANQMEVTFSSLGLREQRTRWGSCSRHGHLSFNWRLVHAPPAVIDYVIIHELAHLEHLNHSRRFWEVVGQYDPQYADRRWWLSRHRLV